MYENQPGPLPPPPCHSAEILANQDTTSFLDSKHMHPNWIESELFILMILFTRFEIPKTKPFSQEILCQVGLPLLSVQALTNDLLD